MIGRVWHRLTPRKMWIVWGIAALVSLGLHLFFAAHICCPDEPQGIDGINYDSAAVEILTSGTILDPEFLWAKAYWPVGWPLMLTALYKAFGYNLFVPRAFESLLVAVMSGLVFLIARDLFDEVTGLFAGVATAFSPTFFIYATLHNYEVFIAALLIASLWFLLWSYRTTDRRKEYILLSVSGVFQGLGILTNPVLLAFFPFVGLWELMQKNKTRREMIIRFAVFVALAFAVVLPWTWRNYVVYKEFILVSSHGGISMEIGNNPWATGGYWIPPIWEVTPRDENYAGRVIDFIIHEPERSLHLLQIKFGMFWSAEPIFTHANDVIRIEPITSFGQSVLQPLNSTFNRWSIWVLVIGFGVSVLESVALTRRRLLLHFVIACFTLIYLSVSDARYRVPIYPVQSILQAYALVFVGRVFLRFITRTSPLEHLKRQKIAL